MAESLPRDQAALGTLAQRLTIGSAISAIAGCVMGAASLGAVGGMVGLVTVGGPLALFSAFQYFSTILSPCPPELPACMNPATPAPPK
ncbi:hypothetical protein IU501_13015 [Nocardia otitidiscaviarum]|uniref:hypothetical protein n=1 Tax=Nocardia otitidiscaviarum TaxID=1823 RepID=UPI001895DDEC|nr:hypothetical protein [Nocardia otitidiscaviarum]MBF6133920.1 hypothetical protein [Nocardia otitidiscaviarum]